jgi:2,3-bisphosphoglycerate-dependent phosphoglycerate mutase
MELYLIRHGQSANNILVDQRTRVADPALTEIGRRQAELLARHLAHANDTADLPAVAFGYHKVSEHHEPGYGITRLFSSPMWRSLATSQPVSRTLNIPVEVWTDIHELGGVFLEEETGFVGYGGKTRQEMLEEFPGYVLPASVTERGWWTGALETEMARPIRAYKVAAQLRQWAVEGNDQRVAMVSHGGFLNDLLKALLNVPLSRMSFLQHCNTAITHVEFQPQGRVMVDYINRVDHLPPELVTL